MPCQPPFIRWLLGRMETGEYLAWVATGSDSSIVAGLGLWLMDWPPHMIGAGARRGNILNVYTESTHRRRGIARSLMESRPGMVPRTNGHSRRNPALQRRRARALRETGFPAEQ